jgi:hypothetical protein
LYVLDPNVAFSGMSHNCLPCFPCCGRRRSLWLVRFAGAWLFLFAFLGCAKAYLKQFTAPKIVRGPEDPLNSFSMGTIFGVCGLLALPQSPDPGGWPHQVSALMGACRGVWLSPLEGCILRKFCGGNAGNGSWWTIPWGTQWGQLNWLCVSLRLWRLEATVRVALAAPLHIYRPFGGLCFASAHHLS